MASYPIIDDDDAEIQANQSLMLDSRRRDKQSMLDNQTPSQNRSFFRENQNQYRNPFPIFNGNRDQIYQFSQPNPTNRSIGGRFSGIGSNVRSALSNSGGIDLTFGMGPIITTFMNNRTDVEITQMQLDWQKKQWDADWQATRDLGLFHPSQLSGSGLGTTEYQLGYRGLTPVPKAKRRNLFTLY